MKTPTEEAALDNSFNHENEIYFFRWLCIFPIHSLKGAMIVGIFWKVLITIFLVSFLIEASSSDDTFVANNKAPIQNGTAAFFIGNYFLIALLFLGLIKKSSKLIIPFIAFQNLSSICSAAFLISSITIKLIFNGATSSVNIIGKMELYLGLFLLILAFQKRILYRCLVYLTDLERNYKSTAGFSHNDGKYFTKECWWMVSIHSFIEAKVIGTFWAFASPTLLALLCTAEKKGQSVLHLVIFFFVITQIVSLVLLFFGLRAKNPKLLLPFICCKLLAFCGCVLFSGYCAITFYMGIGMNVLYLGHLLNISPFVVPFILPSLAGISGLVSACLGWQMINLFHCYKYLKDLAKYHNTYEVLEEY